MAWTQQSDHFCERVDLSYGAEPLNSLTSGMFLVAAYVMWRRTRGHGLPLADTLICILALIGVGSFLFHTSATRWAMALDVASVWLFLFVYLFAANRDFLGWHGAGAFVGTVAFIPFASALMPLLDAIPFLRISSLYWTVPLLIGMYAPFAGRKDPRTARGLLWGAGLLCLSITLLSLDEIVCPVLPFGTHVWWHLLTGVMFGWMIEVYRGHMVGKRSASG